MNRNLIVRLYPILSILLTRWPWRAGLALSLALLVLAVLPLALTYADAPTFYDRRPFGDADATRSVAVGDLNGDGLLDIVAVGDMKSGIYLNDEMGNFTERLFGSLSDSYSVALGDVNGDGTLDIVMGGYNEQNEIYLNDGAGNFYEWSIDCDDPPVYGRCFGTGSDRTVSVALGDMNGDGALDIIAGNDGESGWGGSGQQSLVYLNDGVGNFYFGAVNCTSLSNVRCFGTGSDFTESVAVADLDGDGVLDIIRDYSQDIYLNDGVGNFTRKRDFAFTYVTHLVVGDMNGDGILDIVADYDGHYNVYLNDGAGYFSITNTVTFGNGVDVTRGVTVGDVNGDGALDIVAGNAGQNVIYLNDGSGYFTNTQTINFGSGSDNTWGVALGDMNGDGALDLVVGNYQEMNVIYLSDGTGNFASPRSFDYTGSVVVGDVDDDNDLDAIGERIYLNDGTGDFPINYTYRVVPSDTSSVAVGDMNGDGALDIIVGSANITTTGCTGWKWWCYTGAQNVVYLNDKTGHFPIAHTFGDGSDNTISVAVGDMNGDGALDIVAGNWEQKSVIYLNDGIGNFPTTSRFHTYADFWELAVGDLNGDGALDIVAVGFYDAIYLNDGDGNFSTGRLFGDVETTTSVALGDMNGDGALDIVVGNTIDLNVSEGRKNLVYLNDGAGYFSNAYPFGTYIDRTYSVVLGDMNGDGALDIVTGNEGQPDVAYLNDGTGQFGWSTPALNFDSGSDTYSVAVGDVNGDGALDIVTDDHVVYLNSVRMPARLANTPPYLAVTRPGAASNANFYSAAEILDSRFIPITYTLFDPEGDGVGRLEAFYSPDGGGRWYPAVAAAGTPTTNLGSLLSCTASLASEVKFTEGFEGSFPSTGWGLYQTGAADDPGWQQGTSSTSGSHGAAHSGTYYAWHNDDDTIGDAIAWLVTPPISVPPHAWLIFWQRDYYYSAYAYHGVWITTDANPDPSVSTYVEVWSGDTGAGWPRQDVDLSAYAGQNVYIAFRYIGDDADEWYIDNVTIVANLGIPDNGAISSTLACRNSSQVVQNLELSLILSHPQINQLSAALYTDWPAPTGTHVLLFDGVGNGSLGFADLTLSDQAARSIATAAAFYTMTSLVSIDAYTSTDVPKSISSSSPPIFITSTLVINAGPSVITDVNVSLEGLHTFLGDLVITLQSPLGSQVTLMDEPCGGDDNFDLILDDEAAGTYPCPPIDGGSYRPDNLLSAFDGEDSHGTWLLIIEDTSGGDGGSLEEWGLRINATYETITISMPITGTYRPAEPVARLAGMPVNQPLTLVITDSTPGGEGVLVDWSLSSLAANYIYTWDTFTSGFLGQSDNIVFRLEAYPQTANAAITGTYRYTNTTPGPYQWPYASATTFPFRVRGTQVQVYSETVAAGQEMAGTIVYRIPQEQATGGFALSDGAGVPYRTNAQGYLQGRGQLNIGDRLVALLPITSTGSYTLYHTSAQPTETGLDAFTVSAPGVQQLAVSANNRLLLFDLDVSLEWDARQDTVFLEQLEFDLRRASDVLFDVTNGQVALGSVNIYHNREHWMEAHVRIYATNAMRPNADIGGMRTDVYTEVITTNPCAVATLPYTITYGPGQVRIGSVWNRFGEASGAIGEDWPRVLAHELSHYLFYLHDNYLALNEDGVIVPASYCAGSLMTDPYPDDYSEFRPAAGWDVDCAKTLSSQRTGRADWETLTQFYPWLAADPANNGPVGMPLAVTQIRHSEIVTPPTTLVVPIFYLTKGGASYQPGSSAQAILYQAERLIDLGQPSIDKLRTWGARVGDRLCVYEPEAGCLGCETIAQGDVYLTLVDKPGWQPDIIVTPITSRTVDIAVANVPVGLSLQARVYPGNDVASASSPLTPTGVAGVYSATFTLELPSAEGYVQVWVDEAEPRREMATNYALGGNPGRASFGFGRSSFGFGRASFGFGRASFGFAPASSTDGQVVMYGDVEFEEGQFYALQKATVLPNLPIWATVVGNGYRLMASPGAPSFAGTSLNFRYLGREVPPGEESFLSVYYWDGVVWEKLPTIVNAEYNEASAVTRGPGLYVLASSLEIPLYSAGWNLFAYPVQATRPVTDALLSVNTYYTTVYGYDARDVADPWKVYDKTTPGYVNQLHTLEFGKGYWINVSEAITLYLKGASSQTLSDLSSGMGYPPATYYGPVMAGEGFTPVADVPVTAWVNGNVCGRGVTLDWQGQVVYTLDVFAEALDGSNSCGRSGKTVTFHVGEQTMAQSVTWDNSRVWQVALSPQAHIEWAVYLPLVLRQ